MKAFKKFTGLVAPLDRSNVDTDAIIPKQFLKSIHRTGFGQNLFDEWRYEDHGQPGQDCSTRPLRKDFVLNLPRYQGAKIFLARENFGCGSSREHAVWALQEYGFDCVIAPSFAEIFYSNCGKNGVLAIVLDSKTVDELFRDVEATPGYSLEVDLEQQTVTTPGNKILHFEIEQSLKQRLQQGLDNIAVTLQHSDEIRDYEAKRAANAPWLFPEKA